MSPDLADLTVVVTGGPRGIELATARYPYEQRVRELSDGHRG